MAFTTYFGNLIIDHMLRAQAHTPPANMYVSIYRGDPLGAGVEVAGTGYARQVIGLGAAAAKAASNGGLIDFGTAGSDWAAAGDEATHLGIHDAATAGNLYLPITLPAAKVIQTDDPVTIPIGDLDVTLT